MIETGLQYKGEVTLSYKIGNKIIKRIKCNKGWSQLFKFISLALTGNLTSEQLDILKPTFIDLKYKNNEHWDSCLYSRIPVTPSFTSEASSGVNGIPGGVEYISVFTVTISFSNLNSSLISEFDENTEAALFLLSGEPYENAGDDADSITRMASLGVDAQSVRDMLPGSQVIVEWTMKFYNA